ncbi:MAG: hypothetical protein M1582_02090, partial [Actinobacteria bacterium]|nr:hypothetical protein [Actinomycetota bacterium]
TKASHCPPAPAASALRAPPSRWSAPAPAPAGALGERAVEALTALGFPAAEARRAVALELAVPTPESESERTIEMVVREALRRLAPAGSGRLS